MKIPAATVVFFMIFARAYSQQFISEQELRRMIPKDITHYLDWLDSSDPVKRVQAGQILAQMGKKAFYAVPFLLRYSNNSEEIVMQRTTPMGRPTGDPTVMTVGFSLRSSAEFMLTKVGEEDTSFSFIKNVLLRDDYYKSRELSIEVLYTLFAHRHHEPALELLWDVLKRNKFQDIDILEKLRYLKDKRVVFLILDACKNCDDLNFLCTSIRVLENIGDTLAVDFLINVLNNKDFIQAFGEEHEPELDPILCAISALGKMNTLRAVNALFSVFPRKELVNFNYRKAASHSIYQIYKSPSGVDLITKAHREDYIKMRRIEATMRGGANDPQDVDFLIEATKDSDFDISSFALYALEYRKDSHAAIGRLIELIQDPTVADTLKVLAVSALGNADWLNAENLFGALKNSNDKVRHRAALEILIRMQKGDGDLLIEQFINWITAAPSEDKAFKEEVLNILLTNTAAMKALNSRPAVSRLMNFLRDSNKSVKLYAEILLRGITGQKISGLKKWEKWYKEASFWPRY